MAEISPYYAALQEFVGVLRQARHGPARVREVADPERDFDTAVGRYVYVPIEGVRYRIYFEEAGTGDLPMVLQHTAGADDVSGATCSRTPTTSPCSA